MILVHHLRIGRSIFTVWMLEEMGLEYELKLYIRGEDGRAPAELKTAHPLGKSPVIEDKGFVLAESGAIASYLVDTYDADNKFAPPRSDVAARAEWTQWLHYFEGSAVLPLMMKLILAREADPKPPVFNLFSTGEAALQLGYIEDQLGDQEFLLGDTIQAPDFGASFIAQMAEGLGEIGPYPKLKAYLDRNRARPAFLRAMEKTGG